MGPQQASPLSVGRPWVRRALLPGILAIVTVAAMWPVAANDFISFDDQAYITANLRVRNGLNWSGIAWAFTTCRFGLWHPLTWVSHMLDCQLFGLEPGPHHLHSLALHVLSSVLLYAWLVRMTGHAAASWVAAALFAVHPLRVEPVAWLADRQDVLASALWMLVTWLYAGYVEHPTRLRYALICAAFAIGLMAKAMLMTLPFALLLLDWWPLRRLRGLDLATFRPLVREKVPLMAMAAASAVGAAVTEAVAGTTASWQEVPVSYRLGNAIIAYGRYLGKLAWPSDLAVLYPLEAGRPAVWLVALAALALLAATSLAVLGARRAPYGMVGWLWFVGTLVPVIGFIQIGNQAIADRYTYIPSVGLCMAVAWGLRALVVQWPRALPFVCAAVGLALAALVVATHAQAARWRSSETLYAHTLAVTRGNFVIHTNMGIALAQRGELRQALAHLDQAIAISPSFPYAHSNRARVLAEMGRSEEAEEEYRLAIRLAPDNPRTRNGLGVAYLRMGRWQEAIQQLQRAVELDPGDVGARNDLGIALASAGRTAEAIECFRSVLRLDPTNRLAAANLELARRPPPDRPAADASPPSP